MDLSFAKDSRIWCLAIESLRAQGADLGDESVIKERYEQIANNKVTVDQTQESGAVVTEVATESVEETTGEVAETPRRRRRNSVTE